jgi:hypothetical protein
MEETMKRISLTSGLSALALAAALMGAAVVSRAETDRRPAPSPLPQSRFMAQTDPYSRSSDSRDLRDLVENLESSSPDDINSGRISRFFTNPAAIITDGRVHQIDWNRIRDDRGVDRYRSDRGGINSDRSDRGDVNRDRTDNADRAAPNSDVQIENFETHRIDPHTAVVMYTAVIPDSDGSLFHQPVCATLVRESSGRPWRVASYTAENAAIPGGADLNEGDPLPAR